MTGTTVYFYIHPLSLESFDREVLSAADFDSDVVVVVAVVALVIDSEF
jgi:hypothetical protein